MFAVWQQTFPYPPHFTFPCGCVTLFLWRIVKSDLADFEQFLQNKGAVAEWHRRGIANPFTRVQFPAAPPSSFTLILPPREIARLALTCLLELSLKLKQVGKIAHLRYLLPI